MKRYFLLLLLLLSFSAYSQNSINNYKYVLVPEKFSFLKQKDQYSLNSLAKGLLEYKGFTVYFDNEELPAEVANNRCRALVADVVDNSGAFSTSLTLLLKDCQGNVVFTSKQGVSREKEYRIAYNFALRDAFTSLDQVPYAYDGSTHPPVQPATAPAIAANPAASAPEKSAGTLANAPAPALQPTITTTAAPVKPTESATNAAVQPITAPAVPVKPTAAASTVPVKSVEAVSNQPAATLHAQATANGYQLIDTSSNIVLTLLKTSAENFFIASTAAANGIVLKKNEDWFFEYYKDGKLISEKLFVKF
jgi:hypothetical protein